MKKNLEKLIEGRLFSFTVQGLIVVSLVTFSISTLPELSTNSKQILDWIELFTIFVFTIEYIFRFIVVKNKLAYIFSFFGIVDLLAILPFYLSIGIDLQAIRIFRFFRLFVLLKMIKYNVAINHFYKAFLLIKEELILFSILSLILLYLSAVGIYFFENEAQPENFKSVFHSLWWAVATLTTVGYGDVYPITIGGRIFTTLVLILGLGIVAIPSGLIASALTQVDKK